MSQTSNNKQASLRKSQRRNANLRGECPGTVVARCGEADGANYTEPGRAVTVPFVLPGELVAIGGGRAVTAADVTVLERSEHRVAPGCRHFGVCGGCHYQHAEYGEQLRTKEGILRGLLEAAGVRDMPEITVHAAEPWGYRNRVRMRVAEVDGWMRVGYSSRVVREVVIGDRGVRGGAPEFLPIVECPIAAPLLWRGAETFRRVADEALRAGERWVRSVVEVELFATADEGRLQMTVYVREGRGPVEVGDRELARLCEEMRVKVPELAGAGVMSLPPMVPGEDRGGPRGRGGWRRGEHRE